MSQANVFALALLAATTPLFAQTRPVAQPFHPASITFAPTRAQQLWADRTLRSLTLEEKIGQMIEVRGIMGFYSAEDPHWQKLQEDIRRYHLGAVHLTVNVDSAGLVRTEPYEAAMTARLLRQNAGGKVPLIFSVDFERGPSMRLSAVEFFPHAMAFGAAHNPAYVEQYARIVAEESRAMGIAWNFFPIADVQINPKNPIINTRSFGEDPAAVSAMVSAYIRGSHAGGMLTALKHFPGHGDTDTDSHTQLSRVNAPLDRLNTVELPPFKAGIAAGSDAVMIAHVAFPAIEPDPNRIATTSHNVVTGLLRDQLGFHGVIVSDAMEMQGLTKLYPPSGPNPAGRAAVDAVKAGQDFLELPSDLDGTVNGLLQAVRSGEIPQKQIDASVRRLLLVKAQAGLDTPAGQKIDLDQLQYAVGKPSSYALAQEVADHAITLVRDDNHLLPLAASTHGAAPFGPRSRDAQRDAASAPETTAAHASSPAPRTLAIAFVSDVHSDDGRTLERELRARIPGLTMVFVDRRNAAIQSEAIASMLPRFDRIIAAVYSVPQPGQPILLNGVSQTSMNNLATGATILQNILDKSPDRTAVLAMGSPYLILDYPAIRTYLCAFSSVSTSERAAVRALFGEIPIHGKLPVTLPNIAPINTGIVREIAAPNIDE